MKLEIEVHELRFNGVDYLVIDRAALEALLRPEKSVAVAVTESPEPTPKEPEPVAPEPKPVPTQRSEKPHPATVSEQIMAQLPGTTQQIASRLGWEPRRVTLNLSNMRTRGKVRVEQAVWYPNEGGERQLLPRGVKRTVIPPATELMAAAVTATPAPDPNPNRLTNKDLIRQALADGPKTLIGVSRYVQEHGRPQVDAALCGKILAGMELAGEVESDGRPDGVWSLAAQEVTV